MASDLDQHIPALNLYRINRNPSPRSPSLARLRVPLPAMPGTNNFASRDYALAERAAAMQADVIHGADFAVYVGDADGLAAAGEFFGLVGGGEVGLGGDL